MCYMLHKIVCKSSNIIYVYRTTNVLVLNYLTLFYDDKFDLSMCDTGSGI